MDVTLTSYQESDLAQALKTGQWGYEWEVGLGKTVFGLKLCEVSAPRTLVVTRANLVRGAWAEEAEARRFEKQIFFICGETAHKRRKIIEEWSHSDGILVINKEAVVREEQVHSFGPGKRRKLWRPGTLAAAEPQLIVVDESSMLTNHKSAITLAMLGLCERAEQTFLLTGYAFPRGREVAWPQLKILRAFSETLSRPMSYPIFMNRYFVNTLQNIPGIHFPKWKPREETAAELDSVIAGRWTFRDKASHLPELPEILPPYYRRFDLSLEERRAYVEMKRDWILTLEEGWESTAHTKLTETMRLRQSVCGFVRDDGGVDRLIAKVPARIKALDEVLDEIGPLKVVVVAQFKFDRLLIKDLLQRRGDSWAEISGSVPVEKQHLQLRDFKYGDKRVLIGHPMSMGHGLTLSPECSNMVFYNGSYDSELYVQAKGRIHRMGAKDAAAYWHILANVPGDGPGVDQIMLDVVLGRLDEAQAIRELAKGRL